MCVLKLRSSLFFSVVALAASAVAGEIPVEGFSGVRRMPIVFSGRPVSRVCHDFDLKCDLRTAQGLAFDFLCEDPSGIGFGFYARSGREWAYVPGGFGPVESGKRTRIIVRKEDMYLGSGAAGWDSIDGIRFSFWRNGTNDTVAEVSNVAVVPADRPTVAIVRAEAKFDSSVQKFGATFARTLRTLGVGYVVIADTDLRAGDLADVPVVALPYTPQLGAKAEGILKAFVARGGKLICGAYLPSGLHALAGIKLAGGGYWPRSEGRPAIAGMRKAAGALEGQPDFVPTVNWGASGMTLAGEGSVVAAWEDVDGKPIGLPAVLKTPVGFVIGHVWLGGVEAEAAVLMGAMLKDLVPGLASAVDRGVAAARKKAQADARRIESVRRNSKLRRGAWCMTPWGVMGRDWDASIARLKAQGVDFVVPCMANAASACYKSGVLVERPAVAKYGDALTACVAACRRHGVECHVWKMNFTFNAANDAAFSKQMEEEGRLQVTASGAVKKDWLCPSDVRNVKRETEAMVEIARKGVDGVQFDFIRYHDGNCCYCPRCRARFEKRMGRAIEPWPGAISGNAELEDAWRTFRCETISRIVEVISKRIRRDAPGVKVSGAVFDQTYTAPHTVGQDWVPWCEKGWLDFACPMSYIDDCETYARTLAVLRRRTSVPLYPGVGVSVWQPEGPAVLAARMAEQAEIARKLGFEGYTVFELDRAADETLNRLSRKVAVE